MCIRNGVFLATVVMLVSGGCKTVAKLPSETDIVGYLAATIEKDKLNNPDNIYYKKTIKESAITKNQQLLWDYWRKANKSRLDTWTEIPANSSKDSLVWDLPENSKMLFSLFKKGTKPIAGYPLFINLHGGGTYPSEPGSWTAASNNGEWKAAKKLTTIYEDAPSLYFVPRMADDRRGRWYHHKSAVAFIRAWQLGVLSGTVDPDKTYIMGISEGGYGSFRMGIYFADYFAGAGPMAGPIWKDQEPLENLRNSAFFISVGERDNAYQRATNGRDWKLLLDSAANANKGQFNHRVDIQEGKGHGIDYTKTAPWLKQFSRKNYPDTLTFVYYAQCDTIAEKELGRACYYRTGFGHVRLDGLSKGGERSFSVVKKGNIYTITSKNIKANTTGSIKLYVENIDFDQPVQVFYNDKLVCNKRLKPNMGTMMESLALFGDPRRIFPAFVDVKVE